ncbi:hypothetical protein Gpo141_00013745, partial [Globisporangium polare]
MTLYAEEQTARANDANVPTFPTAYDEKDDYSSIKAKLAARKKPIYAGLAFLAVVVIGVSIGVSTGSSTNASTGSGESNSDLTSGGSTSTDKSSGSKVGTESDVLGSVNSGTAGSTIAGGSSNTFTQTASSSASSSTSDSSSAGHHSSSGSEAGLMSTK